MELSKMFQNNTFPINFTFPNYTCFNFRSHFVEWRSINAVLFISKFHFWNWTKFWVRARQNNVMRESKNWHTKWQRKMHDNDRSPYWLSLYWRYARVCVSLCVRKYVTVRSYYVWIVPLWTIMVIAAVKMFLFLKFSSPRILELDLKWYSNSR